jgi:hypothetical protein
MWVSVPALIPQQEHLQRALRPPQLDTHGAHEVSVKQAVEATGQHTYLRPACNENEFSSDKLLLFLGSTVIFAFESRRIHGHMFLSRDPASRATLGKTSRLLTFDMARITYKRKIRGEGVHR